MGATTLMFAASAMLASAGFATTAEAASSGRNAPNLAACRHLKPVEGTEIQRTGPIAVPAAWSGIARTDMTRIAFSTLGGRTLCVDASWIEDIHEPELSADGRFARFEWYGYETGGYFVVDRAGNGVVFDTGDRPVPSPSGKLAAVVQYSEAGFGSLEGFGVWQVGDPPMREQARLTFPEGLTDWRMDGWHGDACVLLSAVRFDDLPENEGDVPRARRQQHVATASRGQWRIAAGSACKEA